MAPMIRFLVVQTLLGAAVGTAMLAALITLGGPVPAAMLAEALEQPGQLAAIWFGAVAPFALGFLATALCLARDPPASGRGEGIGEPRLVRVRARH